LDSAWNEREPNTREGASDGRVPAVLIIGYGNISRRDDSVALHIILRLRERLGMPEWHGSSEPDEVDENPATIFLHQLAPELAESLSRFDLVVFVDAHVDGMGWEPVHRQEVVATYRANMVTHHLNPDSVLALCRSLYGRCPEGYVVSVLGHDFDFGEELSPATSALADEAVDGLLDLLRARGLDAGTQGEAGL
jgi:hydrogenase maturation protease